MDGKWRLYGALALLFGLMVGCRTTPPNLKPVEQPEVLYKPPQEARFNNPGMPKEAFNREDPSKRFRDMTAENPIMPARGSMGGPNSGMMR